MIGLTFDGFDTEWLLNLSFVGFTRLARYAHDIQKKKMMEAAICARVAQADSKGWKEFTKQLGEEPKKGTLEDFERLLKTKR